MHLLLIYASSDGQTKKISHFLVNEAQKSGHGIELVNARDLLLPPGDYDGVIVAASVHMQHYQKSIMRYLKKYHERLNVIPGIFVSVSLTATGDNREAMKELKLYTNDFLKSSGWKPIHIEFVAGALLYTKYGFLKRFIMHKISQSTGGDSDTSRDYEYTDWEQVKNIIRKLEHYEPISKI